MRPSALLSAVSAATLLLIFGAGCKSYQLGSEVELPFDTLYVKPVVNDAYVAQVDAVLSSQIRETLLRSGRVRLVADERNADATLEVVVTRYDRRASARRSADTALASSFDLVLEASVTLTDNRTGSPYFRQRKLSERVTTYVDNPYVSAADGDLQDFTQAEYQNTPKLTRDLARSIADQALGAWGS